MGSVPAQASLARNSQATYKIAGTIIGSYTIQDSDTFSVVANRLGLDLNTILAANPGVKPEDLQVGQVINLPSKNTGLVFNLNDVARVLGVSVQDLQSSNPGISNNLTIGETIKSPASSGGGQTPIGDLPGGTGGSNGGGGYVNYSGARIKFP